MNGIFRKTLSSAVATTLFLQAGCGTILHPERRGQTGGRVDAGIVVLDAIGLLFFILPGVIAFAVDFSNGTIYLPGGSKGTLSMNELKQIKFDPKRAGNAEIERLVRENTGIAVKLDQRDLEVLPLKSRGEMLALFAAQRGALVAGR